MRHADRNAQLRSHKINDGEVEKGFGKRFILSVAILLGARSLSFYFKDSR